MDGTGRGGDIPERRFICHLAAACTDWKFRQESNRTQLPVAVGLLCVPLTHSQLRSFPRRRLRPSDRLLRPAASMTTDRR